MRNSKPTVTQSIDISEAARRKRASKSRQRSFKESFAPNTKSSVAKSKESGKREVNMSIEGRSYQLARSPTFNQSKSIKSIKENIQKEEVGVQW